MSDIEWSPWIRHEGVSCPDGIADVNVCVRLADGGEDRSGLSFARTWRWSQDAGEGTITHLRIPMADYKRITGMPEWSEAPEWVKYIAQWPDGKWIGYRHLPDQDEIGYQVEEIEDVIHFSASGTVLGDWRDTLQERPANVRTPFEPNEPCRASLDTHPDSELDADQYSVGADTFPQNAEDELLKRVKDRNLNPYDAPGFLEAALGHMEDRKATYDAPEGERSMGKTVAAFNAITGRDLSEEEGWLMMVLLKAVRTQQGAFRADNYEDGAAYFALQGEAAARDRGHE